MEDERDPNEKTESEEDIEEIPEDKQEDDLSLPPPPPPPNGAPLPPPPPAVNVTNNSTASLFAQIASGQVQLTPTTVVVKKPEMTSSEELSNVLKRKSTKHVESYKDEIADTVNRIHSQKFYELNDIKKLYTTVSQVEEKTTNVDPTILRELNWPEDQVSSLRIIVSYIDRFENTFDLCEKTLKSTRKDVVYIQSRIRDLLKTDSILDEMKREIQFGNFGNRVQDHFFVEITDRSQSLCNSLLEQLFQVAFDKINKAKVARTKFDLTNLVRDSFQLLQNGIVIANSIASHVRPKDLLEKAIYQLNQLIEQYSSVVNVEISNKKMFATMPTRVVNPLHSAVSKGTVEEVKLAIDANNAIDALDDTNTTALAIAVQKGFVEIVELLLERGASRDWVDLKSNGYLHLAVSSSKRDVIEMLLKHGVNPNTQNSFKETPLHIACANADFPAILLLVNHPETNLFLTDNREKMALFNLSIKYFDNVLSPKVSSWGFDMSRYFNNPALSDVTFRVQTSVFHGHRIILCAQSLAFRSLLEGEWKDSVNKEIEIVDVPPTAFKHMLEYCYTGDARLPREDVTLGIQLLAAADRFLLDDLKKNCEYLLHTKITLENAYEMYTSAKMHSAIGLRSMAARFILQNYQEIEFADVERGILKSILSEL